MPRLTIVIPCLGGAAEFDGTLVSVLQNRPADCEVLVVHTEPYDDPYQLGPEVRFLHSPGRALVELINAAIPHSAGEIIHILGCGLEVAEGWTRSALGHFADREVAAVSPIVFEADGQSIVAAGVRWSVGGARVVVSDPRVLSAGSGRLRTKISGPTLTAGFYRRDVLAALGGFEDGLGDELADIGLALDIQTLGLLHVCEPDAHVVQRCCAAAAAASALKAGAALERLFIRHAGQRGMPASILMHGLMLALGGLRRATTPAALAAALGRAWSWCELGAARHYQQRLANAKLSTEDAASAAARSTAERRPAISASSTPTSPYRRAA